MRATQSEQPHEAAYTPAVKSEPINLGAIKPEQITYSFYDRLFGFRHNSKLELYEPYILNKPTINIYGIQYGSARAILNDLVGKKNIKIFINNKQI